MNMFSKVPRKVPLPICGHSGVLTDQSSRNFPSLGLNLKPLLRY